MTSLAVRAARRRSFRLGATAERAAAIVLLVGVAVWLIASLVKSPSSFFNYVVIGLNNGALYALVALGYTLVYGIIELINFAHGDLFMLGTLLAANMMVRWFGFTTLSVAAFGAMAVTLLACMLMCATLNVSAEFFAYRRLRSAPKLAPLITAVGLSFIFQNVGQLINGSGQPQWNTVFTQAGVTVGGVKILYSFFVVVAVTAVLLLAMTLIVQKTRQGKAMRAVAQDQDGARLMGINVNRTISFTFALGGALAGAAALLFLETQGYTRYDLGFRFGLIAFTAAVLGGIGNLTGAVLGGLLIGIIQALNEGSAYGLGQNWSQTVVFSILILVLVFKPEGLFGRRTTEKV